MSMRDLLRLKNFTMADRMVKQGCHGKEICPGTNPEWRLTTCEHEFRTGLSRTDMKDSSIAGRQFFKLKSHQMEEEDPKGIRPGAPEPTFFWYDGNREADIDAKWAAEEAIRLRGRSVRIPFREI